MNTIENISFRSPKDHLSFGVERDVLLISPYNASLRPWYGVVWEFFDVIADLEQTTVIAPPARRRFGGIRNPLSEELTQIRGKAANAVRSALHMPSTALMETRRVERRHDLCLFMCQFVHELTETRRVERWREHSDLAFAFVLEAWPHELAKQNADIRLLDRFDHVFTMNPASAAALQQYTTAPVSFLPTGADCLRAGAKRRGNRCIDFLSIGRLSGIEREVINALAGKQGLLYVHDIWRGLTASDWGAARRMNAEMIRRARHFMVWDPATLLSYARPELEGQRAISTRYFEGAAGGAALLGSKPALPEFDKLFDWPDAVIELPHELNGLREGLEDLLSNPERCRIAGALNRAGALARHDWAHRWDAILQVAGLPRTTGHDARLVRLQAAAAEETVERVEYAPLFRAPAPA